MATRDTRREENQQLSGVGNESLHDAAVAAGYETERVSSLCECAEGDCLGRVKSLPVRWGNRRERTQHYLVIVGHAGSEAEKAAGSIREYESAWKPG